ncbi:MAG: ABC transporter substrate-binding protein [Candidatus Pacebacteria bacterium]|nr:ABC transporter substrate-binding protein [Candidatus Paceibacterota bacterium]
MRLKTYFTLVGLAVVAAFSLISCKPNNNATDAKTIRIGITQIAANPGIDAIRKGFIDEMTRLGYNDGTNIIYKQSNAQGDMPTAQSIAQNLVQQRNDLIFAITTPSAQTVAQAIKGTSIPLVFGAVTDPVSAGLVTNTEYPGGNITGTSDRWPVDKQFDLLLQLVPNVKRVGIVYNPGEANAEANLKVVETACKARNLETVKVPVANTSEVQGAAQSLVGRCDAMYVPADNTVITAMQAMVKVSEHNKIPLLPGVSSNVEQGGFGTLGPDYSDIGVQSAKIVDQVLKGKKAGEIPVASAQRFEYFFNKRSAAATGVTIPEDLLKKASKVYE